MAGLLDALANPTVSQGLLGLAAGMLNPRGTYGSFGASFGNGLLGFQQGEQNAQAMALRQTQANALNAFRQTQAEQVRQRAAQQQEFSNFFHPQGTPQGNGVTTFPVSSQDLGSRADAAIMSGNPMLVEWGVNVKRSMQVGQDANLRGRQLDQNEWSAPQQTSSGFVQVNRVTGQTRPVMGQDGKPLLPTTIDPNVQGSVAQAKGFGRKSGEIQAGLPQQGKESAGIVATAAQSYDRLIDSVNGILKAPGLNRTLGVEGMFPNFPGGEAANAEALKDTLKSQIAFTVLQSLRDASKTGGAVGQVSDQEEQMMINNLAALDKAQSPEQYREQLQKILDFAKESKQRMANAYKNQFGSDLPRFAQGDGAQATGGGVSAVTDQSQYDALPSGSTFKGPDGKYYRKP